MSIQQNGSPFSKQQEVYNFIYNTLKDALSEKELIPRVELSVAEPVSPKSAFLEKAVSPSVPDVLPDKKNEKFCGETSAGSAVCRSSF